MVRVPFLAAAVISFMMLLPPPLYADSWDLNLSRLCQLRTASGGKVECGGGYTSQVAETDPLDPNQPVIPDNAGFRSLMSELGAVFAPNLLFPSDTRGYSGFSFASEFGWTMINPKKTATDQGIGQPRMFWRAANSVTSTAWADVNHTDFNRIERELPSSFAPTVTLMARKGLWIPIPSCELGVGFKHLFGSKMWAPTLSGKVALHEGFHGWPVPSLAIRGTAARVLGTPDFNLSIAGLDFSVSKRFGVASTFNLTPYLGYQLLWIVADSEVLDATPGIDAMAEVRKAAGDDPSGISQCRHVDCNANFTFSDQSNITRHRFFMGIKANFFIGSILFEYTYFANGSTSDNIAAEAGIPGLTIADESGTQHSLSFALALDY
jgi:hypothetical protein